MSITCVREPGASVRIYEDEVARRWYALPPGVLLPLSNGDTCQLLFAGRPGSAIGPDVRDAVLRFSPQEIRRVGDVEFHVRASDWFTHQHHTDARYNNVLLHVVLICDNASPALRQDGESVPMCSLSDLSLPHLRQLTRAWPCQTVMQQMATEERARLLRMAGLLRFEQKAHAFVEQLRSSSPKAPFSAHDTSLIVALAEGLGYGRDRAFFRAAGQYLLGLSSQVPEPLGRTPDPSFLDASRLPVLRRLVERWHSDGAWKTMRKAVDLVYTENNGRPQGSPPNHATAPAPTIQCMPVSSIHLRSTAQAQVVPSYSRGGSGVEKGGGPCGRPSCQASLLTLRAIFAGLGTARADILICNVVLPFAMAVALVENDHVLAEQAQRLYLEHPGLSSNRVTRAMSQQLQLAGEPEGACQQQGLHYIYQQTCKEKRCAICMVGARKL